MGQADGLGQSHEHLPSLPFDQGTGASKAIEDGTILRTHRLNPSSLKCKCKFVAFVDVPRLEMFRAIFCDEHAVSAGHGCAIAGAG